MLFSIQTIITRRQDSFLAKGNKNFLTTTCNPFSLISPNLLCQNSKEVPSIAYNLSLQTFPWVLYKVQHVFSFTATNEPLVSFHFPLPKWFSYRKWFIFYFYMESEFDFYTEIGSALRMCA